MMIRRFSVSFAVVLVFTFSMPFQMLFMQPPKAHAFTMTDFSNLIVNTLQSVYNGLSKAAEFAQEALQYLFYVKEWILEPLAYIQSGKASQALTGGMLSFVAGQSNGTGASQFVGNIPGHFRSVQDNASQAFLKQLRSNSNSPYAGVVASSLRNNYLQDSSVAGFFAANRNTLPQYSSNPQAFLAGDWSKGGLGAWFAVTTQSQNNPYAFYQSAQSAHAKLLFSAEETHKEMLDWGKGFLSWCGALDQPLAEGAACDAGGYGGTWTDGICMQNEASDTPTAGVSPGAPCAKKDGTPGEVQTPGTTITSYLDKTLSLDSDKLTKMGNAATQITQLVGTLMETVQMAQVVIGGPQGGLAGVGKPGPDGRSLIDQYTATSTPYGGVSQCSVNNTIAGNAPSNGQDLLDRLEEYVEAWLIVGVAAEQASVEVTALRDACAFKAQSLQGQLNANNEPSYIYREFLAANKLAFDAGNALTNYIQPLLTAADQADEVAAAAEARVEDIRAKLSSEGAGDPPVCQDYSVEIEQLRKTPPTAKDLILVQQDALSSNGASTTPPRSLILTMTQTSTAVDEMKLLTENAVLLLPQCAP